jgi:hypothetical protein
MSTVAIRERIQVYIDPRTKRRVELAAAKYDVPVTDYCLEAIIQRLAEDELLTPESIIIQVDPQPPVNLGLALRALHEAILDYRQGVSIDVDAAVNDTRDERDEELTHLS